MARGFDSSGSGYGVGTTDRIQTTLSAHSKYRTYSIWVFFHPGAGASAQRIFAKHNSGDTARELWLWSGSADRIDFQRSWSGGDAIWSMPTPSLGVWHHFAVTYDSRATTNVPVMYMDGTKPTVTTNTGASGSIVDNASFYHIGNRGAGDRVWQGILAEFAVWNRILTWQEITLIYGGQSPESFPVALVEYLPLNDPILSRVRRPIRPTVVGTAQLAHPKRIIGPSRAPVYYHIQGPAAYTLDAAAGSYTITGQSTDLFAARILNAAPGTYAVSGLDSLLVSQRILNAATGSYVITGADALLVAQRMLAAGAGSYLITGADALIVAARQLNAAPGSYAITGADAILLYTPVGAFDLLAEPGVYAITGANALNLATRIINAEPGTYVVSGANAQDIAARTLLAEPGSYDVSGADANLLYTSFTPPAAGGLREKRKWRRGSA